MAFVADFGALVVESDGINRPSHAADVQRADHYPPSLRGQDRTTITQMVFLDASRVDRMYERGWQEWWSVSDEDA
jgi:hypothetical protein